MSEKDRVVGVETVPCKVCLKEVPRDEAQSPEGTEYVFFLCGSDCYEQWARRAAEQGRQKTDRVS